MEPKFTFELGVNLDSVQITEGFLIIGSRAMVAEYATIGDVFSVILSDGDGIQMELFAVVFSKPEKKTERNEDTWWLSATRLNV